MCQSGRNDKLANVFGLPLHAPQREQQTWLSVCAGMVAKPDVVVPFMLGRELALCSMLVGFHPQERACLVG